MYRSVLIFTKKITNVHLRVNFYLKTQFGRSKTWDTFANLSLTQNFIPNMH